MSEKIDNSKYRKTKLKEFILKLHGGESQKTVFNGFQSIGCRCLQDLYTFWQVYSLEQLPSRLHW